MRHAVLLGKRLQFAMTVSHANRANVVSFREQQFQNHQAVLAQSPCVRLDFHSFYYLRNAGRF